MAEEERGHVEAHHHDHEVAPENRDVDEAGDYELMATAIRERLAGQMTSGFVRVTTSTTASISSGVTVWLPNGVRLSLPSLEQPGLLERLARL